MDLLKTVETYVSENIHTFHEARISKLKSLKLEKLLKKKNPYLYRAKNLNTPQAIVDALASAFMISAEESMFGDWLEQLAVFVAGQVYGGYKSASEGIDIELNKNGIHYLVSVKSGPNWSNSSSMKKLLDNFARAKRVYRTSGNRLPCEAIEGCCYGQDRNPEKATHTKLCGQQFWSFISGSDTLYCDIIQPIGTDARKHNEEYSMQYACMITRFTKDFANAYCHEDGTIDWDKIIRLNSESK